MEYRLAATWEALLPRGLGFGGVVIAISVVLGGIAVARRACVAVRLVHGYFELAYTCCLSAVRIPTAPKKLMLISASLTE